MIHADRFANAGRLLTVAAFAVCVRKILYPLASELAASAVLFVHAWLIANAQIPGGKPFLVDETFYGDITFRHARLSPIGTTEGFMKKLQKTNIVIDISRNIDIIEAMDKIEIFKALSNETRLNIMEWLKEPEKNFPPQGGHFDDVVDLKGGVCVGSIRDKAGVSQSTISHYLDILQKAGLLLSERHGKWTYYRRNEETLAALSEYFGHEI